MSPELRNLPRRVVEAIVNWSVARRWLVLLLSLLLTGYALHYTAGNLSIDTDTSEMIDVRLPHRQANFALAAAFPHLPGDVVVFASSTHAGAAEDAADALAARLAARADIAHAVSQPGGGEFFRRNGLLYLSADELWRIDERLAEAAPLLGTLAHDPSLRGLFGTLQSALEQPLDDSRQALLTRMFSRLAGALAATDGAPVHWRDELFDASQGMQRAFVLIDPAREQTSFQPEQAALDKLHVLLAEMAKAWPDVQFQVTGPVPMNSEELVTVADDTGLTTLLSFVAVALVLVWGLRSPALVVAVLLTLAFGLIWTAALATALVGSLNIISVCFAVLFIGMGVDFGIQFAMRYLEECDHGRAQRAALGAAGDGAGGALVLAAVGAAISFAAFVPTSYRGLAQLGVISSFSMGVALVANITLLPAVLSLLKVPHARPPGERSGVGALVVVLGRHGRLVLAGAALLTLGSLALLPQVEFDPNPANLKDRESPSVKAFLELATDPLITPYTIEILSPSADAASARAAELARLPSVDKVVTLHSLVPEGQDEKLSIIEGMATALTGVIDLAPGEPPAPAAERAALEAFSAALAAKRAALTQPAARDAAGQLEAALRARLDANADMTALRDICDRHGLRSAHRLRDGCKRL